MLDVNIFDSMRIGLATVCFVNASSDRHEIGNVIAGSISAFVTKAQSATVAASKSPVPKSAANAWDILSLPRQSVTFGTLKDMSPKGSEI